jgi:hypothetical protein
MGFIYWGKDLENVCLGDGYDNIMYQITQVKAPRIQPSRAEGAAFREEASRLRESKLDCESVDEIL